MKSIWRWRTAGGERELGGRTLVCGVINATPDSFSDGGRYFEPEKAIAHGLDLWREGAEMLDIGGESTRPGASVELAGLGLAGAVSAEEEAARVLPVIEGLRRELPDALISIDTWKSSVARQAVAAGADVVNDVSGMTWDAAMAETLASLACGVVLMHARGLPREWRSLPAEPRIFEITRDGLQAILAAARAAGVAEERIVLDPGYGFGKNFEENYLLLARQKELLELGRPLLIGLSRKSCLAQSVDARLGELGRGAEPLGGRLPATLAAHVIAILHGAQIVRVHEAQAAVEAAAIADAMREAMER